MLDTLISVLFISILLNLFITKILYSRANSLKLIDIPDSRKIHSRSVPVISGLAMFITLFFLFIYMFDDFSQIFLTRFELLVFSLSTIFIFIISIIDDSFKIPTFKKILFQSIVIILFIFFMDFYKIQIVPMIDNYFLNFIVQFFFILGVTNSINLMDGLDNLVGSISIIISISFILLAFIIGFESMNFVFTIIIGCLLSYLIYNNFFNRIFLGDGGSLLIGWIFSIFSIVSIKFSSNSSIHTPLLILAVPAFDVIYIMIYRFVKSAHSSVFRKLRSIFIPDHLHIHYSIFKKGIGNIKICLILCIISVVFTGLSFLVFIYINNYLLKSMLVIFLFSIFSLGRNIIER